MPADVTPPGREAQVQALKERPGVVNPYAVAWASYEGDALKVDGYDGEVDAGEHADIIQKRGGSFVLLSKATGKVLGTHETKEGAEKQEAAIKASQHADDCTVVLEAIDAGSFEANEDAIDAMIAELDEVEHVPAGSPQGGQFTSSGSSGGSAKTQALRAKLAAMKEKTAASKAGAEAAQAKLAETKKKYEEALAKTPSALAAQAEALRRKIKQTNRETRQIERKMTRGEDRADVRRVRRIDAGTLAPADKLPNGWLRVEGRSAKAGILEYENADGSMRRELVLPDDLFDPASLATARMVPVTNNHPQTLLDDATAKVHQVGSVGENLRPDGDYLVAPLMVTDGATVRAIEQGLQQLSWGYDCQIDPPDAALVPTWGQHDGIQRGRSYNHLAIVQNARAGDGARIRLDSAGNAVVSLVASQQSNPEIPKMKTITINGVRFPLDDEHAPEIQAAIKEEAQRLDAAEKAKGAAEKLATATSAKLDGYKGRVGKWAKGLKARLDAMKARMCACDECGGGGKVMDAEGAETACPYCDGEGAVRFHEMVKSAAPAKDAEPVEEDLVAMEDDLSGEPAVEEEHEVAANPEHDDPARKDAAGKRATARKDARDKRSASFERRADARARARAALLTEAGAHLDAADIAKKPDGDIRKAVVAKLAPHVKMDGLDDKTIGVLYAAEIGRAKTQGSAPSDALRAAIGNQPAPRKDAAAQTLQQKIEERNKALYHSHEAAAK